MRALLNARSAELVDGATPVGWKVALDNPAVQALFGLDGLVVGYLNDTTVHLTGASVDISGWVHPTLEAELALRVGPDGSIEAVAPAIELVDLDLPFDRLEPILSGNLFHRAVIFGPEASLKTVTENRLDVQVTSELSSQELARGTLGADPLTTLEHVRDFLARYDVTLEPGHRVIAGTIVPPQSVSAGDRVSVNFGQLGSVEVSFASR
jgi:2-keto-4-pentenoate hydratase